MIEELLAIRVSIFIQAISPFLRHGRQEAFKIQRGSILNCHRLTIQTQFYLFSTILVIFAQVEKYYGKLYQFAQNSQRTSLNDL